MSEIESAIDRVENLFRAVTGKDAPVTETAYAPIPPEKDPSQHVQEQMERLFQLLGGQPAAGTAAWAPPIAVWESPTEVLIFADVPGTARDRIELTVQANALIISGNRPAPIANGHRLRFGERAIGEFRRVIPLPLGLKTAELTARLRDGVLEIILPRDASAGVINPRPVPIA